MNISISTATDAGLIRDNNEDALAVCPSVEKGEWQMLPSPSKQKDEYSADAPLLPSGSIIVIADGMGGARAGEVAATIATETARKTFTEQLSSMPEQAPADDLCHRLMREAIANAHEAINARMIESPDTAGMGTTIVICWITPLKAHIAWCGDSRCYIYTTKGELTQATKDHSYVQELVDRGEITYEEALVHPDNNIITRGLGDFDSLPEADIVTVGIADGDTIMLCTDGLCGYCNNKQIEQAMEGCNSTTQCARNLTQLALDTGGDDNVTVAVATVSSDSPKQQGSKIKKLLHNIFG